MHFEAVTEQRCGTGMNLTTAIRRLASAARKLEDKWLPAQEDVLESMEEDLESGQYKDSLDTLVDTLKSDAPLFLSSLKILCSDKIDYSEQFEFDGLSLSRTQKQRLSPVDLFSELESESIRALISETRRQCCHHSYLEITEFQATRLEEAVVSATAAEAMAFASGIDPSLAYTTALMRQLGYSLAAWNYPKEYRESWSSMEEGVSFDEILNDHLGFSPLALNQVIADQWSLDQVITAAIGERLTRGQTEIIEVAEGEPLFISLARMCQVGEALGRAVHAQHYPTGLKDWTTAYSVLEEVFGETGVEVVLEEARQKLVRSAPYKLGLPLPPMLKALKEKIDRLSQEQALLKRNKYLSSVPSEARYKIEAYIKNPSTDSHFGKSFLTCFEEVLQLSGFVRACIYTGEPSGNRLVARVSFGPCEGMSFPQINLKSPLARFSLPASAFSLKSFIQKPVDGKRLRSSLRAEQWSCALFVKAPIPLVLALEIAPESQHFTDGGLQKVASAMAVILENSTQDPEAQALLNQVLK